MKKSFRNFILVCSLFAIFNVALFAEDAVVTSVKGKVEVSHGGDAWTALAVGDKVSESDVVSTGFQSEVRIKYNGSVMLLGALTRVTLNQMSSNSSADKVDVFLNTGAVRSKVTHSEDRKVSYNVRGPVAVASVRGTDFTCFANGNVMCFEGAVAVYSAKVFAESTSNEAAEETEEEAEESSETESTEAAETTEVAQASDESAVVDEGPASATTPAQEISETAPAGAVVVAQNQETTFSSNGKAAKPIDVSTANITKAKNQVSTAASKESVSTGATAETPAPVELPVKKGSILVKVEIEE